MEIVKLKRQRMKIIGLVLLSLFLSSQQLQAEVCSYPNDPSLRVAMDECNKVSGKSWNCRVNTCLTSQQAKDTNDQFEQCSQIEVETERNSCYQNLAKDATEKAEGPLGEYDPDNWSKLKAVTNALAVMHIVSSVILVKYEGGSLCPSMLLYILGGVVGIGGEIYNFINLKKNADDLENDFVNMNFEDSLNAQQQAFEFLAKEQDALQDVSEKKSLVYKAETAIYAGVIVATVAEMATLISCDYAQNSPFKGTQEVADPSYALGNPIDPSVSPEENFMAYLERTHFENGTLSSPSIEQYQAIKENPVAAHSFKVAGDSLNEILAWALEARHLLPQAHADEADSIKKDSIINIVGSGAGAVGGVIAGAMAAGGTFGETFKSLLKSPYTRIILAGISAGIATKLFISADKQAEMAEDNAKKLRQTAASFTNVASGFCASRTDSNDPKCYCQLKDGSRDPDKANSNICKNFFAARDKNYHVGAGDYNNVGTSGPALGCVNRQRAFDPSCQCKKTKDSKGNNNCLTNRTKLTLGGLGGTLGLNSTSNLANDLVTGELTSAQLSQVGTLNQATRNKNNAAKLLKKLNDEKIKKGQRPIPLRAAGEKIFNRLNNGLNKQKLNDFAKFGASRQLASNGKINSPQLKSALSDAKKKAGVKSTLAYQKGSLKKNKKKGDSKNPFGGLDFGSKGSSSGPKVIGDYMEKDYKYKENDIIDRPETSIFKILTNRYNQTGLERLFSEDEKVEK